MLEKWIAPFLASYIKDYVEDLDPNQLKAGIWGGDISLHNLRLKKGALDKFKMPVDVIEGFIGNLSVKITWSLLKEHPVQVEVDDIYLLAVPAAESTYDAEEDAQRQQQVKMEKLRTAEMLSSAPTLDKSPEQQKKDEAQMQGMFSRIADNLQITVKRVHLRYEDRLSVPGHPFAAGFTLAGFSAQSTNENWEPSYIVNSSQGVHKLANLESLAVYFDTDTTSMAGMPVDQAIKKFNELIASQDNHPEHQFVLKPVSGQGRLLLHKGWPHDKPKTSAELLFKEIGFVMDDDQYRDALSMVDLFQFYKRQHQYQPFRPTIQDIEDNKPRALWKFACRSLRNEIHQKHVVWSWAYFKQRRDDRLAYVDLFKKRTFSGQQPQPDVEKQISELEQKLNYRDLRFYRSIARAELKKQQLLETQNKASTASQQQPQQTTSQADQGWVSWLWGSTTATTQNNTSTSATDDSQPEMDESSRKQLDDLFDWDQAERQALSEAMDMPPEAVRLRVHAKLDTGSFVLRRDPHGSNTDMVSLMFDAFSADVFQRPDNFEAAVALGGIRVYDATCPGSIHSEVCRVKSDGGRHARQKALSASESFNMPELDEQLQTKEMSALDKEGTQDQKPFFFFKFEKNPLDKRADMGVTMRLRYMEIFYHARFVEEVVRFFQPPDSQLESVTALVDAANETFEGFRKGTRASLEMALQEHKRVDVRVDMNAPVIIIPEDITKEDCLHVVVDAGHIGVESQLVDDASLKTIRDKQSQQYSPEDWRQLEALMYDKFIIQLQATQIVLGDRLEACMSALQSDQAGPLHVLGKINMDWTAESSIVSHLPNFARFKLSGHLPDLSINFSDRKYRSLMRMIDIAIPHFGSISPSDVAAAAQTADQKAGFRPTSFSGRSRSKSVSYAADYDDDDSLLDDAEDEKDSFFEAPEYKDARSASVLKKTFELNLSVDRLSAAISRSHPDPNKPDRLLAVAVLEGFRFSLGVRTYDMAVDVVLRALYIEDKMVSEKSDDFRDIVTSKHLSSQGQNAEETDLVRVKYERCSADSPEFQSVHEGFNQSIDVEMSTLNIIITRASILMLLDFILTTFTGPSDDLAKDPGQAADGRSPASELKEPVTPAPSQPPQPEKMRIKTKLNSIVLIFNDDGVRLATLELAAGDVAVFLRGPALRVSARLGNMFITDDLHSHAVDTSDFRRLLTSKDDEVADFQYETFDPSDPQTYPGYDTLVHLRTGSLQFNFLEEPVHRILRFLTQFGKMKAVFDAARSETPPMPATTSKMHFDVIIKTPVILFPRDAQFTDLLVANLGEFRAKNSFNRDITYTDAGLRAIRLASRLEHEDKAHELEMLADLNLDLRITEVEGINRTQEQSRPDMFVEANLSDVKMNLTERQYGFCMALSQTIPRAIATRPEEEAEDRAKLPAAMALPSSQPTKEASREERDVLVDLYPELPRVAHTPEGATVPLHTKLQVAFKVNTVSLDLFSCQALDTPSLRKSGMARFAFNGTSLQMRMDNNGSIEAEVCTNNFRLTDTDATKNTKWREIIPASRHKKHDQIMLSYSMSGGGDGNAVANLTIDTPTILFSLEPMYSLRDFFLSAFDSSSSPEQDASEPQRPAPKSEHDGESKSGSLSYRVNIACAKVVLLADPERSDTEAVVLNVDQLEMAQQGILALNVSKLGMSLCKMDNQAETIRLLDDFDITLSQDARTEGSHTTSNIDLRVEPVVLRVSYRDIMLVQRIVSKAIELSNSKPSAAQDDEASSTSVQDLAKSSIKTLSPPEPPSSAEGSSASSFRSPQVMMTRERMQATFDGLQIILVGDIQELPLLRVQTPQFTAVADDWSSDLKARLVLQPEIKFFNLSNSQWEPLMEPWDLEADMTKLSKSGKTSVTLASQKRLEVNLSSTFIDIAKTTHKMLTQEGDAMLKMDRGAKAPFLIRNRTGYPLQLRAERTRAHSPQDATRLDDGKDLPWRFNDWRTMREHIEATAHNGLTLHFEGTQWENLNHVSIDTAGEHVYSLLPKVDGVLHRLMVEVKLSDNVKVVTFRSTFIVENLTSKEAEMVVLDRQGKAVSQILKIAPGGDCSVPIEAAYHHSIRIRPGGPKRYNWPDDSLSWQDLVKRPSRRIACPAHDNKENKHVFQAYAQHDKNDPLLRVYPRISLKLRPPIEIENLLPFDFKFYLWDQGRSHTYSGHLRHGEVQPVHVTDLWSLLMLSVEVADGKFNRSDFGVINTNNPVDLRVEDTLAVEDKQKLKLWLRLNYVRYHDSAGAFKVQVYCPFVFINKTGRDFALKSKSRALAGAKNAAGHNIFSQDHSRLKPVPFLFSFPTDDKSNRALLRVGDSDWSKPVSFDTVGAVSEIALAQGLSGSGQADAKRQCRVGMRVTEGTGAYTLTRVVTIYPRYIVRNNTQHNLRVRLLGDDHQLSLSPNKSEFFMNFRNEEGPPNMVAALNAQSEWTPPFAMQEVGVVYLRYKSGHNANSDILLQAEVLLEGATVHVRFSEVSGMWPYIIKNDHPAVTLRFHQTMPLGQRPPRVYEVAPKSRLSYAFDVPAAHSKSITVWSPAQSNMRREVGIMEIGPQRPIEILPDTGSPQIVAIDTHAEQSTQSITFSKYDRNNNAYKIVTDDQAGGDQLSRSSSASGSKHQHEFEIQQQRAPVNFEFEVKLEGIGISLINKRMRELAFCSFRGFHILYRETDLTQSVSFSCKWIQLDNQLPGGLFPIVLYPSVIPKDGKDLDAHPNVEAQVTIIKDQAHGVTYFKYASLLIQQMTIELDEDFIFALVDFSRFDESSWQDNTESKLLEEGPGIPEPQPVDAGGEVYFEVLHLQPIALDLSFMRTDAQNSEIRTFLDGRNPVAFFLNALTMALGNVNDASIKLSALYIENLRASAGILTERAVLHYSQQFIGQVYRVLGSADFLGNPVGLFNNVSSGVADIFYQPLNGFVVHGNTDLGYSIAKGAGSFVKKTVFGFSDSFAKFTGSVGKGLAVATLDREFQSQRRMRISRNKPKHALYGITGGANSLVTSVASGIEGLARHPYEGAEQDGAAGFFKGMGKGMVGFMAKPAVGFFDLANSVTEGIRNTTTVFDPSALDRVRQPRVVPYDGVLRSYDPQGALGQTWLRALNNGSYEKEFYVAHTDVPAPPNAEDGHDYAAMLTRTRIMLVRVLKLRVVWDVPLADLKAIDLVSNGLTLSLRHKVKGPFLYVPDEAARVYLYRHLQEIVRLYNQKKLK